VAYLLAPPAALAQAVEDMDVFGVAPESVAELERCFGGQARALVSASLEGNPAHTHELEESLERRIEEAGGFSAVDIEIVHYFEPGPRSFLTFNVTMRSKGPAIRYLPDPVGEVADPGGLLAAWREYEKLGGALVFDGQIEPSPACPAHHCLFGFDHPKLRRFGDIFTREVPARREQLVKVLRTDKNAEDRAAAAYLLAHLRQARDVVAVLLPRLRDPAPSVRNSVMRVLAYMADHGATRLIPAAPVIPFLGSPFLTDRNKAVGILAALATDGRQHSLLVRRAGCDLVRLLEMKQPNQSDLAHTALVNLRGADLGATEISAWKRWLAARGVSCRADPIIHQGQLCPPGNARP
jgi:hypothetical protein